MIYEPQRHGPAKHRTWVENFINHIAEKRNSSIIQSIKNYAVKFGKSRKFRVVCTKHVNCCHRIKQAFKCTQSFKRMKSLNHCEHHSLKQKNENKSRNLFKGKASLFMELSTKPMPHRPEKFPLTCCLLLLICTCRACESRKTVLNLKRNVAAMASSTE